MTTELVCGRKRKKIVEFMEFIIYNLAIYFDIL